MGEIGRSIRWGVEQRMEFIEFRLFWEGGINRSDIIDVFGVSVPQASKDISTYIEQAPHNIAYDKSAKKYVSTQAFSPIYLKPDADAYLSRLRMVGEGLASKKDAWIGSSIDTDIAISPHRVVESDVLRSLLEAIAKRRSAEVCYQSVNPSRPTQIWRRITPHAFGYDGFRWHARAWCHLEGKFKDFILPRLLEIKDFGEAGAEASDDVLWQEFCDIKIKPHPGLTTSQKRAVEKDYAMQNGVLVLKIRLAMLYYVLKRLGLLGKAEESDAHRQHIVLADRKAAEACFAKADILDLF